MPNRISETNSHDQNLTTASQAHHKTKGFEIWSWQVTATAHKKKTTIHLTLAQSSVQPFWEKWIWAFIWWVCTTVWSITKYNTEEVFIFLKHKLEGNVQEHCMVNSLMVNNWFHLLHCIGKLIKTPLRTQTHDTIQNLCNDNLNSCLI